MDANCNKGGPPRAVCIGGGTGLSTMLRGLKLYTHNITAIVTVADDGGGSGALREELGMLPPGDIRNCLLSLANIEPMMQRLLSYRFDNGNLKGQSFGNLFIAAMFGISGSFEEAVSRMGDVLAITGRVLPVTAADVNIEAEFTDGVRLKGESTVFADPDHKGKMLKSISLVPPRPAPLQGVIDAIEDAELIVLGPGSLYTSIMPNLLVDGVADAVARSKAVKIYIANLMTQSGETEGYSLSDHIAELFRHSGARVADVCLANTMPIPQELLERYAPEGARPLEIDREKTEDLGIKVYEAQMFGRDGNLIRHNPRLLAKEIIGVYRAVSPTHEYGR
ncbi:MAG: YvcK family protein [Oscillospiraceae bacterium]|nr:YvcK family protein [Oscillospiraceae bacterium]